MLQEIYINNFILIDEVRLEFFAGLNVLTGETGAGKSIIIDALNLIMGERIKTDFIRDSGRKAIAQAIFDIQTNEEARNFLLENDLLEDDQVIVSREILPSGRSSARINGSNVPLSILKNLASYLLDMHLQHENQNILQPDRYLHYIDSINPEIGQQANQVAEIFNRLTNKQQQLQDFIINRKQRLEKMEFLNFQVKEIESGHLQVGEKEELIVLREKIQNANKLMDGSVKILNLLYSSENSSTAYDLIFDAVDIARELDNYQPFASMVAPLQEIYYALQDMASHLNSFKDSLDFEPGLLDHIEKRLYDIEKLENKYGKDINELLNFLDQSKQDLDILTDNQESQYELEKNIAMLEAEYFQEANR
ncbi:MAG: AAA family ATPase, partial [Syntrophomonas sp.]